ncbi:hypothetical protein JTB14_035563 [Gonioctena quinquepunctata]|nr:hypothetical protein JTB14_035563 [Gonioctena quinquepunctata]
MPLKKRKLLFQCNECEHGFKLIPVLFKKVESLEETVQKLKDDANNCTIRSQPVPELTTNTPLSNSELMHEFEDRTKRTKNVMIYNVNEITSRTINERINHDTNEVNNILTTLGITENPIKIIRLGKATGKPRPLKVIMHTQQAVKDCLKNRKNLTESPSSRPTVQENSNNTSIDSNPPSKLLIASTHSSVQKNWCFSNQENDTLVLLAAAQVNLISDSDKITA